MYWANFLHIYQPPTQIDEIICKVTEECYKKLVLMMERAPKAKITLNINAVLTQHLDRCGYRNVIEGLRNLAERGQIEFVGSAMYHPILPLIPKEEVVRQIELNTKVNKYYFGKVYNPRGFFSPEMCYSFEIAKTVAELGFSWILVDEISFQGKIGGVRNDTIYYIDGLANMVVFFKERPFSAGLTYGKYHNLQAFFKAFGEGLESHSYLLTGTDGEIYGHHRRGQEKLLEEVFRHGKPKTCTISDLLELFPRKEKVSPLSSSWSTWEDEMAQGTPYPQWSYPGNDIHELQWRLTNLAIKLIHQVPKESEDYEKARCLVDEGLHSCQYWWASCRPWWDTGMIEAGARRLYDAIKKVEKNLSSGELNEAKTLFNSIIETARQWQETDKAKALKREYLEEHKEVTSELTFGQR